MFNLPSLDDILNATPGDLVTIQVICSFSYKWKHKQHYLATGDTVLLHKERDREELEYLLSPTTAFPERDLLRVIGITERTSREIAMDEDYSSVPALPTIYDPYSATKRVPPTYPTQEAVDWNPHALQAHDSAGIQMPNAIRIQGETPPPASSPWRENEALAYEQPAPPASFVMKVDAFDPSQVQGGDKKGTSVSPREQRENELRHMNGRKMKPLAEMYGITWTTREEAIPQILSKEFDKDGPPPNSFTPTSSGSSETSALPDDYSEPS